MKTLNNIARWLLKNIIWNLPWTPVLVGISFVLTLWTVDVREATMTAYEKYALPEFVWWQYLIFSPFIILISASIILFIITVIAWMNPKTWKR